MTHYTYRITNIKNGRHYYGTRTSKLNIPTEDIGINYFSSSSDKDFMNDQKINPQNYKYKVILIFDTRKQAIQSEIKLHNKFNVGANPRFYNKCKQTSTGFDRAGVKFKCIPNNPNRLVGAQKRIAYIEEHIGWDIIGQKISDGLNTINPYTGNSISKDISIKGGKTKLATIHPSGKNTFQHQAEVRVQNMRNDIIDGKDGIVRSTENMVSTRNKLDSSGLTSFKRGARRGVIYRQNNFLENGLSIQEDATIRGEHTKRTTIRDSGKTYYEELAERMKGSKNPSSKLYIIYDNNNILRYVCNGTLKQTCNINDMPLSALRTSCIAGPIYTNLTNRSSISKLINNGSYKFKGWYIIHTKSLSNFSSSIAS